MESEDELYPVVFGNPDVAVFPEVLPGLGMALGGLGERPVAVEILFGGGARLAYGPVVRCIGGDQLLHVNRRLLLDSEGEALVNVVLHLVELSRDLRINTVRVDPRTRSFSHVHPRLPRLGDERDRLPEGGPARDRVEVATFELPVAGHALVGDASVQRRENGYFARPVLRRESPV